METDANLGDSNITRIDGLARTVEGRGVDDAWVNEVTHSSFTLASRIAAETDDSTLGFSIPLAFPRSSMMTAYTSWDLQKLSQERFILGLSSQVTGHIGRQFGIPWTVPGRVSASSS